MSEGRHTLTASDIDSAAGSFNTITAAGYILDAPAGSEEYAIGPIVDGQAILTFGTIPEPGSWLVWGGLLTAGCFCRHSWAHRRGR